MQSTLDFGVGLALPPANDDLDVAVERAVKRLTSLLLTHPVCVAWSSGKDSSCVLLLVLVAILRLRLEGLVPIAPIFVMHGDTEVESPAVASLAADHMATLEAWCLGEKIDLRFVISRPALSATFAVKVLSGGALPVFASARRRTCSVDWKIEPAKVSGRRITAALQEIAQASGVAFLPMVTLIGTRLDESASRAANMDKRGDNEEDLVAYDGRLLLAPIATWSEELVWEMIGSSGFGQKIYPVWQDDFSALTLMYRDALSGECPIVAGAGKLGRAGCGARMGCYVCLASNEDKSLTAMTEDARHAHLRPLLAIRNVMQTVQTDYSRRSWLTRQIAEFDGVRYVKIQPDHLDSELLLSLVGAYLLADQDEDLRAQRFDAAVRAGKLPDDKYMIETLLAGETPRQEYVDRMRRPQFATLPDAKIVALDFYSSVLGKHRRPWSILELVHRIRQEGYRPVLPQVESLPHAQAPEARWLALSPDTEGCPGFADPITTAYAGEACFDQEDVHHDGLDSYVVRGSSSFDVDPEAAGLLVNLVYPTGTRQQHHDAGCNPLSTIHTYLTMGIVSLSPGGRSRLNRIVKTRQHLDRMGLYDLSTEELLGRSVRIAGASTNRAQAELTL